MSRGRLLGLLAVLSLLAGALVLGTRGGDGAAPDASGTPSTAPADLGPLLQAAALAPCPTALGTELPDERLPCLAGGPDVALRGVPARPSLLNVWGTWCGPCVEEVPLLVSFAQRAAGRVDVVGVLTEDSRESALTFAAQFGVHYPQVVDDDAVVRRAYGSGTPLTLLVDATGKVAYVQVGAVTSEAQLDALVRDHLGVAL